MAFCAAVRRVDNPRSRRARRSSDPITGVSTILCSTENEVFVRGTGKSSFRNVTSALTTITLVAGARRVACGTPSVSLFATCLQDFLWQYDNNGLKPAADPVLPLLHGTVGRRPL